MPVIAYDTETTGLDVYGNDKVFAYATCDETGKCTVKRLDKGRQNASLDYLEGLWSPSLTKVMVMHNAKFDLAMTEKLLGRKLDGMLIHDTMIMSHLLQNDHTSHALDTLAWELCAYPRDADQAVKKHTPGGKGYEKVPEKIMNQYQENDVERTMLLFKFFWPKIQQDKVLQEIYQFELDLLWPTMRMEERGIMLDIPRCEQTIKELHQKTKAVLHDIRVAAEMKDFNPGSTKKLAWLIHEKLKLPVLKKTPKGQASVDKDVLFHLRQLHPNPVLDLILQYRSWTRGTSILTSYLDFADSYATIHPCINTCGAQTGRESCSRPNLQNVEKTGVLLNPYPVPARRVFRPRPGYVNMHVDYAGIEMRILIHYSDDPLMLECLNNGDGDVHSLAASIFYGDEFTKCTDKDKRKTLRSAAKNANFAIPYGASAQKVAATLGLSLGVAHKRFALYKQTFPRLASLTDIISQEVMNTGYTVTAFGRRLYIPKTRAYMGINHRVQGTAAEILKRSQVRLYKYFEKHTNNQYKMLLPIHDELIIEIPRQHLSTAQQVLAGARALMIDFPQLKVPLEVEFSITTRDWATKHDYQLEQAS